MRENRPYGSEGGEQRYCSPTPIGLCAHGAPPFVWIPTYAGTTTCLSLATFEAPGFFASLASIVASVIFPGQQCAYAGATDAGITFPGRSRAKAGIPSQKQTTS